MSGGTLRMLSNRSIPYTPVRGIFSAASSGWSVQSSISSSSTTDSTIAWRTPQKTRRPIWWRYWGALSFRFNLNEKLPGLWWRVAILVACITLFTILLVLIPSGRDSIYLDVHELSSFQPLRAKLKESNEKQPDPIRWLNENSNDKHAVSQTVMSQLPAPRWSRRPRGVIISLVRNSELPGIIQSMQQLEYRWNRKYQYPWAFFNDEPFSEDFKAATRNLTSAPCYYEVVPKSHWSLPDWIDEGRFMNSLEYLGTIGVGKGWMVSYHHMCRWNSGFFYKHPFLKSFDWYWRVEPNVHYFCDLDYDVFRFMRDNGLKYGFNMNILDDARSFPSLWDRTREFAASNPSLVHQKADLDWLLDPQTNGEYNNCQFFSNFEIGSLNFWRSKENEAYFDWLDKSGGFYYERFGDAPVHTLSVAMFLPKSEVWFFRDIGYQHDINHHCPPHREGRCSCEPTSLDENFYKLVPFQSPQKKPLDTCIRQFLGGEWLKKREGWTASGEKAFGGDGYHGYELAGDE